MIPFFVIYSMIRLPYIVKLCVYFHYPFPVLHVLCYITIEEYTVETKECYIFQRWWSILSRFPGMGLELMSFGWAPASWAMTHHGGCWCNVGGPFYSTWGCPGFFFFFFFFWVPDRQLLLAPSKFTKKITCALLKAVCPQIPYWVHFTLNLMLIAF
jgi:hypothetical protein